MSKIKRLLLAVILIIIILLILFGLIYKRDEIQLNKRKSIVLPKYKIGSLLNNSKLGLRGKIYILDYKLSDVTGDTYKDAIILIGRHETDKNDIFADSISVIIQDGKNGKYKKVIPSYNAGYSPYIDLYDLNNDKVQDIFFGETVAMSGGAGISLYNIFTYRNNELQMIFGKNKIGEGLNFKVTFLNDYKVKIKSLDINKELVISVRDKKKEYDSLGVYKQGRIMEDNNGDVDPFYRMETIDLDKDGVSEIKGYQYVSGVGHSDSLGELISTIKYNEKKNNWDIINIEFKKYK